MIIMYGYLPTVFTELKTLDLDTGSTAVLTLGTSAEAVNFEHAVAYLNSALSTATGGDITCTFSTTTGRITITRASGANWEISDWKARGFFGFDYPVDQDHSVGGVALGAQMLEGLEVEAVQSITTSQGRELYGDSYHHHKGTQLELNGFIRSEEMRLAHRVGEGMGSDVGWSAYKGRVRIVDTEGDAGAWSLTNPTGYIDGRLISADINGQIGVLNAELWRLSMKVAL